MSSILYKIRIAECIIQFITQRTKKYEQLLYSRDIKLYFNKYQFH